MSARFYSLLLLASLAVTALTFSALEWRYASADDLPSLDAGVTAPAAPTAAPTAPVPPDPLAAPGDSIDLAKAVWQRGGWQTAIVLCWVLAAAYVKRMQPKDSDGDGVPDLTGWRGKSWALTGAALMLLGPAAAVALGADGASWSGLLVALPAALAAVVVPWNPVRGSKAVKEVA